MILYHAKQNGQIKALESKEDCSWIAIKPPISNEELEQFSIAHNIPLDFLTDSLDLDERSRYEREDEANLILFNTPILNQKDTGSEAIYVTVPIGVIINDDYVVTIAPQDNYVLNMFYENRVKNFDPKNKEKFVLQLFEQNVYYYLECLKRLNLKRNIIEEELYDSSKNSELKQLLRIEKSLVYFVNSLSSNELLKLKMKRTDLLKINGDEQLLDLFEDIIIDNGQALEMANVHTNILNGTMDFYSSIISNNLNVFIQRLTLVTIILMVPTLVASFYGMNVPLPFEKSKWSFLFIIVISIIISMFLAWFFRRKRLF